MTPRDRIRYAARTDIGRVRTHNEDSVLAQPPLFVVADGLGGHEAGEVASSLAVETLRDHAPRHADTNALARAVKAANREVIRAAKEGIGRSGMGTTLTAAMVENGIIAIAHVGDSRAYLLHGGRLRRLTEDHSMVADMIRMGQLTEAESRVHPNRSVITRALGTDSSMEADTYRFEVEDGDRLLLCSDGLTGMLEDPKIEEILGAYRDPAVTAQALIAAANDAGGQDNISVVVVEIETDADKPARKRGGVARAVFSIMAWLLALALVVGGIGYGVYRYSRSRAFVIAEDGVIAVYRGVPGEIAGVRLAWRVRRTDVPIDQLSTSAQRSLKSGVQTDSISEALVLVEEYRATLPETSTSPAF